MEDEPINQNYLIGCDTIENSPSNYTLLIKTKLNPIGTTFGTAQQIFQSPHYLESE